MCMLMHAHTRTYSAHNHACTCAYTHTLTHTCASHVHVYICSYTYIHTQATDRTPTFSTPSDPTDDAAVNVSKASPNATQALPSSPSQASPSPTPTPPLSNVSKRSAVEVEPLYSNKQISVSGISLATRAEVAETSKNQGGSKGGQKMKGRPRHPVSKTYLEY